MISRHLIFEGAELSGKSWLLAQVYDYLEPKYNRNKKVLDGCHWFNCDIGVYGTKHGKKVIENYLKIFTELKNKNLLVEKLHLSDIVYNRLHNSVEVNYRALEKKLKNLGFKIILITFPEDEDLLRRRIKDRLSLYPHYERILREPKWYIKQQQEYLREIKKSSLPYLIIKTNRLPDKNLVSEILKWLGEK
jgi:thymidylate kinase